MPISASNRMPPPTAPATSSVGTALRCLRWTALGSPCALQYAAPDDATARAFELAARTWVESFEARYSRFRPDSLLSQINAAAGRDWVAIDSEMEQLLTLSGSLHSLTQGVLDVTALPLMRLWDYKATPTRVPTPAAIADALALTGWSKIQRAPGRIRLPETGMALDFGGWGKEYAVDIVARLARQHGLHTALIDFGHDLYALGSAPGKPAWHIGLEDPARPAAANWASLALRDCAVACSGDYLRGFTHEGRRYGHIIDPRTGYPVANGCRQVTVIAPSCLQAGLYATALFILGPELGLRLLQDTTMGIEACVLTEKTKHQTKGFYRHVVSF